MTITHNYLFDISIYATVRIDAADEASARRRLTEIIDQLDSFNVDNDTINLSAGESEPALLEIDGEDPETLS